MREKTTNENKIKNITFIENNNNKKHLAIQKVKIENNSIGLQKLYADLNSGDTIFNIDFLFFCVLFF